MSIRMIATKDMTYATRRLQAGDPIENVSGPNSRLLIALGRAALPATDAPPAIPDNWAELPWPAMKSLAASITDEKIKTKEDAVAALELEVESRKAKS